MPQIVIVDGVPTEFPDGMSDGEIQNAIHGATPGPQAAVASAPGVSPAPAPSSSASPLRLPAMAGSAAVKGLAVGAGIPGDLESLGVRYLANPLSRVTGIGTPETDPENTFFPTSNRLLAVARGAGLIDRPDLVPTTPQERYGSAGIEGLASAAPMLLTGGAVGPMLAGGGGGGLLGESVNDLLPGDHPIIRAAVGALGGLGISGLTSLLAGTSLGKIARSIGSSETRQEAGTAVQNSAGSWLKSTMPEVERQAWEPVDANMHTPELPSGPTTPLTNFTQALTDITDKGGSLKSLVEKMQPVLPKQLLDALNNKTPLGLGIQPPWDDVRALRTALGDGMTNSKSPLQPIGQANLDKLYAAATEDLRAAAGSIPNGLPLFDAANQTSAKIRTLAEQHIKPLVAEGVSPEQAAGSLLRTGNAGGTKLAALRLAGLGPALDELASAHLLQTPQGWLKLSPEAKAALVPDPQKAAAIEAAVQAGARAGGSPGLNALKLGVGEYVGNEAGHHLGVLAHSIWPGISELTGGAVGSLVGLASPLIYRGVRAGVGNPNVLYPAVAGGVGGVNALAPQRGP